MTMIEGRNQSCVFRQKHAIAENVAGHVTDADAGERFGLDVPAHLTEVALDGFPRALRRNSHPFVIVAMATAGRKSITEPETARFCDLVCNDGKGRGAFIGGYYEIWIVSIVAHRLRRRNDCAVRSDIVG